MTTSALAKMIRVAIGYSSLSDGDLLAQCNAALTGLTGNASYPAPPVSLTVFGAAVTTLTADVTAALDGGQKAATAKDKQRAIVIQMMRQLATYVETASDNDPAVFATSGFVAATYARTAPQQLAQPNVPKIAQGNSGQLLVTLSSQAGANSHGMRYAALVAGVPGTWIDQAVTSLRPATAVNNLTPGTTYAFQVRSLNKVGYSPWSDSATRMTI